MDNHSTYLCGGVVFFLITVAAIPKASAREHKNGKSNGHSEPELMEYFVKAISPDYSISAKAKGVRKDTTRYKQCEINGSANIPFNDNGVCSAYKTEVKSSFYATSNRMETFITNHIRSSMKEWLVKTLLFVIEKDPEIADTDSFYIMYNGTAKTKTEILAMTDFTLPAFLVGIMHYILANRADKTDKTIVAKVKTKGQATLDILSKKEDGSSRIVNDITHLIKDYQIRVHIKEPIISPELLDSENKVSGQALQIVSIEILNDFKMDFETMIEQLIESDFESTSFDADLKDDIQNLCKFKWDSRARLVLNTEIQTMILEIIYTMLNLSQFLSSQYMHKYKADDGYKLIMRTDSIEETYQLNKFVISETQMLRSKLHKQYQAMCEKILPYIDEVEHKES